MIRSEARVYVADCPIDWWQGWTHQKDYLKALASDDEVIDGSHTDGIVAYGEALGEAKRLALNAGWEGDMRDGPYVSALPDLDCTGLCPILIAWKQDNNGTTFIFSPFELPWLKNGDAK